jgi:hypothetical protein
VPLPVPDAPEVTVIQEALLCAVQGQPEMVVMLTMPLLPDAEKFWLVGLVVKVKKLSVNGVEIWLPQELETTTS